MNTHTPESLSALRQHFYEHLAVGGYRPSTNTDGEIMFRFEGKICYLQTDSGDLNYVRLVIVNFRPIENEADQVRVLNAVHEANSSTKVVKFFTLDGDTWCTAEMLFEDPAKFTEVMGRTLSAVRAGLASFNKALASQG